MILPVDEGILFFNLFTHFIACDHRFNSVVLFLFFFFFLSNLWGFVTTMAKKKKLMEVYLVVFMFTKLDAEM